MKKILIAAAFATSVLFTACDGGDNNSAKDSSFRQDADTEDPAENDTVKNDTSSAPTNNTPNERPVDGVQRDTPATR
jgi:hypothetical protein